VAVGTEYEFSSRESADEYEQGRTWQVKVGEQRIGDAKTVSGFDRQTSLHRSSRDASVVVRRRLNRAHRRGADDDDPSAVRSRSIDRFRSFFGDDDCSLLTEC
jgi:hypothetical protein